MSEDFAMKGNIHGVQRLGYGYPLGAIFSLTHAASSVPIVVTWSGPAHYPSWCLGLIAGFVHLPQHPPQLFQCVTV